MMKKKSLLNFWLLLLCMIAGAGTAWADTTYKLTQVSSVEAGGLYVFEQGGYVMSNTVSSSALQTTNNYKTTGLSGTEEYVFTLESVDGGGFKIKNVSIPINDSSNKSFYLANTSSTSMTYNQSGSTWTFSFTDGIALITNKSNSNRFLGYTTSTSHVYKAYASSNLSSYEHAIKVYKLEEEAATAPLASIALSGEYPTSFFVGDEFSHVGMVVTATYEDSSTKNVTNSATFSGYNMSEVGFQTVTVSYTENALTKTAEYEISVSERPKYTVTFSDGGFVTQESYGAQVTLPSRDDVDEYTFAGWSITNVSVETTTAPTIIPAGSYTPTEDITLYPVYTRTEGGGGTTNKTVNVTISDYATAQKWDNGVAYQPLTMDENVSIGGTISGNNFKYYSSDNSWRFYTGGSFTITTNSGTLSSVKLTFLGGLSYNDNSITSGTAFDVTGATATISCTSNSKITAIEVKYTISGGGTTYYWSSPVAAAVARPVIALAENPFLFFTTATITCATEGAAIKYSYDGENWSDYSEALTITETKTIYAKAIKGDDESAVAQVTVTKNLAEPTVTIDATGITNTNVFDGTDAGSLSASVTYNEEAVEGAVVTWSGNNDEVATINAATGAVTLVGAGSVTFTATFAANSDYSEKTATYEMTVTNTDPNAPGSENNPYTVTKALEVINELGDNETIDDVYVSGYVSETGKVSSGTITYYISVDGTTTSQLQVYKGKGLNNENFTNDEDIEIYDKVTVFGQLKKYVKNNNVTPEFNSGNYLISQTHRSVNTITVEGGTTKNVDRSAGGEETLITLSATATNGATVTYSIDTENTTLNENNYLLEGSDLLIGGTSAGIIKIIASAAGDLDYYDATETITINVAGEKDTPITYTTNVSKAYGQTLTLVSGEDFLTDGVVTLASSNTSVATIDGLTVTAAAVGTATIIVTYAEGTQYKATTSEFTFTVTAPEGGTTAYKGEGTTITLDFTTSTWKIPTTDATTETDFTYDGYTITLGGSYRDNSGYLFLKNGGYMTLQAFDKKVTQIDVVGKSGASGKTTENIYVGDVAVSSETTGSTGTNIFSIDENYQSIGTRYTLKVSDANAQITSIVVHFAAEPLTVTLSESGYATYCSEYPLDFSKNDKQTYRAWYVSNVSGTTVTFSEITGSVKSGTPIILYGTPNATCELASVANENTLSGNMLEGTLAPTYVASDEDITYFGLSNGKFVKMATGVVKANKAYLPLLTEDVPSNARLNIVFGEDTPTGIRTIENTQLTKDTYYNLNGQRVENLKKGNLYIVNGKKVLVK